MTKKGPGEDLESTSNTWEAGWESVGDQHSRSLMSWGSERHWGQKFRGEPWGKKSRARPRSWVTPRLGSGCDDGCPGWGKAAGGGEAVATHRPKLPPQTGPDQDRELGNHCVGLGWGGQGHPFLPVSHWI